MSVFYLSKEEKLELQNSVLKIENLNLSIEKEKLYQEKLVDDICKRLGIDKNDLTEFNVITGIIRTKEEKEELKDEEK